MCGIAGIVGDHAGESLPVVERMVERMRMRGPDHAAVRDVGGAVLGHARLSILDLNPRSHQPMSDPSGRFTITYNGEVYNFQDIARDLEAAGHRLRTTSDTEVVLHAWMEWGTGAFARFNGMFALGIWDRDERTLVLARDRFGKKPLFYSTARGVAFASDITALREDPALADAPVSPEAVNHFLAMGYVLGPLTLYEGIARIPPATVAVFRDGRVRMERFWDYAAAFRRPYRGTPADAAADLRDCLEEAVRRRLVSDVPVGCFLSGGVDSSAVTAFARRHLTYDVHSFSIGFAARTYDESADARAVAGFLGTVHHERRLDDRDGRAIVDGAVARFDQPFSDTSLVPMVEVSRVAAEHVKVVLSGDGADELLAGYPTHKADRLMQVARHVPAPLREVAAGAARRLLRESNRRTDLAFKLRQLARGLPGDWRDAHYAWRELHDDAERTVLLGPQHAALVRDTAPRHAFRAHFDEVRDLDPLAQCLYVDAKTWLVDDVLVKVDRATMAFSLEARSPFLDPDLAELCASIPSSLKLRGLDGKHVLKQGLRGVLPERTLHKKKAGFNAPLNTWLGHTGDNEYRMFNRKVAATWGLLP